MLKKIKICYQAFRSAFVYGALIFFSSCTTNESGYVFKYSNEQPESAIRSQSMLFLGKARKKVEWKN